MDHFPFMVDCFKEFNYPQILGMDELQITEIFSNTNRQFLISWILNQIDEKYVPIVESATREELGDIIYCNGFCNASEKVLFMTGKYDSTKQFKILYKMFSRLKNVSSGRKVERDKTLSSEEQETILNLDTNLFPMYGNKRTLTAAEREKKIQDFRNEIEELRNLIATKSDLKTEPLDPNLKHQLIASMEQLETDFPRFQRKVLDLVKNVDTRDSERVRFGPDFAEKLDKCCEKIQSVSKFIKSMRVIVDYKENNPVVDKVEDSDNNNAMMREVTELCYEIAALKNENNY